MSWFTPKCPVNAEDKSWLEDNFLWLIEEFGAARLLDSAVILPTEDFFPDTFSTNREDLQKIVERVCGYMQVDFEEIKLKFYTDENSQMQKHMPVFESSGSGALGTYQKGHGKYIVSLETSQARSPINLIATIAHELGHVRLLGENRIDPECEEDHEHLTDLTTVFFGMGIFTANSCFVFEQWTNTFSQGWQTSKQGYLSEEMFGYALALFAFARGESNPEWARYLGTNVGAYFRKSLKYIEKTKDTKLERL